MDGGSPRLVTVVLTVADLDRSATLYAHGFGLDLHEPSIEGEERTGGTVVGVARSLRGVPGTGRRSSAGRTR